MLFFIGIFKGNIRWKKISKVLATSFLLVVLVGCTLPEASDTDTSSEKEAQEESEKTAEKKEQEEAEQKAKEEAEQKEKEEAEKQAQLEAEQEEKEEAEKQAKLEAEQKEKEEAEKKAKEEAEAQKAATAESLGLVEATVSRVVDGDTVELSDGSKVRLIGVNTPESTTKTEEYGKEASDYTTSKLEGKTVWLQKDVSETDRYGRLLRLVWTEVPSSVTDEDEIRSKMFNADLVLNGYAEPSTYQPDVTYSEYFVKFAKEARSENKGLWAYGSEGTTKGDLDSSSESSSSSNSTASSESSGSSSSSDSSGSSDSSSSSGSTGSSSSSSSSETDFANCTELRKVYPDGVGEDHPAYQPKMDRDKDGWACEN